MMDFTIVTPSFRQLDWLELCLASVADQEGVKIEHIVQDGGTEGFSDFARRMQSRWPDREGYALRMFSEPDQGMYDAVNRGLKKGAAPLCAYLNCDEQYLPGALREVAHFFQHHPSAEVVFGGVLVVDSQAKLISARKPARLSLPHVMTCHLPNFTCAMFFRRSLLDRERAWFDAKWRDCADALWVIERLKSKTNIGRIMAFTTAFTDTGANMNLAPNAVWESKIIRQQAPAFFRRAKILWVLGHWFGKLLEGSYLPNSIYYELYVKGNLGQRLKKFSRIASPFWVQRWLLREIDSCREALRRIIRPSKT
ncbi:MAG: glycosyltransferase [Bacteroidetes bacterium]|nr:glycosyltransferase [Bacteroidota bacterium]